MALPARLAAAGLALALAACTRGGRAEGGAALPTSGPPAAAPAPASLPRANGPSCPAVPTRTRPDGDRPRYGLRVDVRPAEGLVSGDLQVRFTPDVETDRLVFRLWPNGPDLTAAGAHLDAGPVEVDGRAAPAVLDDPTTLVVRPDGGLRAGQAVEVTAPWSLRLPRATGDRISVDGEAVRLGSFFPILAWEPGVGWATDPSTGGFAEDSTAPTADFDLTVTAPSGLSVLASGVADRPGHWTATAMRDVAMSLGHFTVATGEARAPDPVQVTVGVGEGVRESADAFRDKAVAALEQFGRRFGPYPWATLSLAVTPALSGGVEYPGHVMLGPDTLARTASHEVGHQWFYALVGNDQGRDPWLDEGLASWAEAGFEGTLDRFRALVLPASARRHLSAPMTYWAARRDAYYAGVYVQGTQALDSLGPPDLVDCALRVYVAQQAYRVARPRDLVAAASSVFPDAAATLAPFGVQP